MTTSIAEPRHLTVVHGGWGNDFGDFTTGGGLGDSDELGAPWDSERVLFTPGLWSQSVTRNPKFGNATKVAAQALASFCSVGTQTCWPQQEDVWRAMGNDPSDGNAKRVKGYLQPLVDAGYLEWDQRRSGKWRHYVYGLRYPSTALSPLADIDAEMRWERQRRRQPNWGPPWL